jgi:PAS domain S-box-containing protein
MAALSGWALVNLLEKSLVHHELRRTVSALVYVFIVTVPGAWFVFAARFARQNLWLPRWLVPLLFVEPLLILTLALTNPFHGQIHATTEMKREGPYAIMAITHGPFFFVNAAYTYLLFAAGAVFLVVGMTRRPDWTASRMAILLGAMLVPVLGNVAYVFKVQPRGLTDLTPVYFAVSGLAAAWLLFRVRVFDILPVARDFVLDCLTDAVFVLDSRFCILDANLAAQALVPPGRQWRNQPLTNALPELGPYLPAQPTAGGDATNVQLGSAGAGRFWDVQLSPLVDLDVPLGAVVRLTEVTERQRAAEARSQLAAIVESSQDAIIGNSLDGIIVSWNPSAERLYGYSAAEIVGRPFSVLFPPGHPDELPKIKTEVLERKRIELYDIVQVRKDGERIDVSLSISPIQDATGAVIGASAISRDVTERKRLERELRQRVQELAEADRRKDDFLAMLAHELRNPLAPIRNALHVLKMPGASGPIGEQARSMMERQVQQLVRLVDDLLDVSRIMRDKITLQKERFELATLVARAVEIAQPLIDAQEHELTVALPPEPVWLEADLIRLAQVVSNLLTNAAKYTEKGGRIRLSAGREGVEVVLRVKDTGIGIDPEMLPRIFSLFVQADRSLVHSQGGIGVGLSLVRKLVEMHGGTVTAFSEGKGRGSEFIVRLPASPRERQREEARRIEDGSLATLTAPRLRILVVDDNRDGAESLALLLRLDGHEVRVAHDGFMALEAASRHRPDVAFLDLEMPEMDGLELCRRLRAIPALAQTLLVALTGRGQDEDRQRSHEAGFDRFLLKPVEPVSLQRLLTHPRLRRK